MAQGALTQLRKRFKNQIEFHHKDFPLRDVTAMAAEARRCAEKFDKKGQMHMLMLNGQRRWTLSQAPQKIWAKYARGVGADMAEWRSCMSAGTFRSAVSSDKNLGLRMGVNSTPTIFIGKKKLVGSVPFKALAMAVRAQMN